MSTAKKTVSFNGATYLVERTFGIGFNQWVVFEVGRDAQFGPALIFFSDGLGRRVRDYPANWRELTDEELYAVSWNR